MATQPMKKMNKSQKRKLTKLAARQKHYDLLCRTIGGYQNANRNRPGAIK